MTLSRLSLWFAILQLSIATAQLNVTTVDPQTVALQTQSTASSLPAQPLDSQNPSTTSTTTTSPTPSTLNPNPETTTETSSTTTEPTAEPNLGRVASDVLCTCDLTAGQCDINCCCDPDCGPENRLLFDGCWQPPRSYFDRYLCHVDPDRYGIAWNNTPEFRKEWNPYGGMFCIVTDNVPKKRMFEDKPPVKEDEMFEKILPKLSTRWNDKQSTTSGLDNWIYQPFYKQGSPVFTLHRNGTISILKLPRALNSISCNIAKKIEFLKSENYECELPQNECRPEVRIEEWLSNLAVFRLPSYSANPDKNSNMSVRWGDVDKLAAVVVRTCDDQQCRLDVPPPEPNCTHSLASLILRFGYNGTEGIRYVTADLLYARKTSGSVRFDVVFESSTDRPVGGSQLRFRSGNPGYQPDKPLLAAQLNSSSGDGYFQYLQVFPGTGKSRLIRFGQDSYQVVKTNGVRMSNRTEWCSNWRRFVLQSYWGRDLVDLRVGVFGNVELNETSLWLPIEMQTDLVCFASTIHASMVILYSKSGTYDQPQNKLSGVGLHIRSDRGDTSYCTESADCSLLLSQTVSFVVVDSPTYMILPQPPRWKIQLPHDFFYPFLLSSATGRVSIDHNLFTCVVTCLCTSLAVVRLL